MKQVSQTIPNAAGDRSVLGPDYLSGVNSVMSRGSGNRGGLHDVKEIHRTMDSGTKQRKASPEALALMMANIKNNTESKARQSGANWVPGGGQTLQGHTLKKNDSK